MKLSDFLFIDIPGRENCTETVLIGWPKKLIFEYVCTVQHRKSHVAIQLNYLRILKFPLINIAYHVIVVLIAILLI